MPRQVDFDRAATTNQNSAGSVATHSFGSAPSKIPTSRAKNAREMGHPRTLGGTAAHKHC